MTLRGSFGIIFPSIVSSTVSSMRRSHHFVSANSMSTKECSVVPINQETQQPKEEGEKPCMSLSIRHVASKLLCQRRMWVLPNSRTNQRTNFCNRGESLLFFYTQGPFMCWKSSRYRDRRRSISIVFFSKKEREKELWTMARRASQLGVSRTCVSMGS